MQGKIIKGIAGFYYVHTAEAGIYECHAKGIFRKNKIKPLVGDNVIIDILSEEDKTGNISKIITRTNELIRPAVSNIDQALVIFSITKPKPNYNLMDRFLVSMDRKNVRTIICFNKTDIAESKDITFLRDAYCKSGYKTIFTSSKSFEGIDELKAALKDKTTTVAGPSGVGKSSIINIIAPKANAKTGIISTKIDRGKHTTRHSEIIPINNTTYIMDTPGFSSLSLNDILAEELKNCFPEFLEYENECRFNGCLHVKEPDCAVKNAIKDNKISEIRYKDYLEIYNELKEIRRY